jgi:hypothetical protein
MSDDSKPHRFVRPRTDRLVLYLGIVIAIVAGTVLWPFTPNFVISLSAFWAWMFVALVVCMIGCIILGLFAWFRYETKVFASANRIFHQKEWSPIPVDIQSYAIDPETILNSELVKIDHRDLDSILSVTPGTNEKETTVPVYIVALGGYDAGGFSVKPGGLGFLILFGDDQVAQLGDRQRGAYWFTMRTMNLLDYSQIPDYAMEALEDQEKFVPGESPVFVLGDIAQPAIDYIVGSTEVRHAVLNAIGAPKIAELISNYAEKKVRASTGDPRFLSDDKQRAVFTAEILSFLSKSREFQRALGSDQGPRGYASASFWRSLFFGQVAETNTYKAASHEHLSSIRDSDLTIKQLTSRTAKAAGRTPSTLGAGYDLATRKTRGDEE